VYVCICHAIREREVERKLAQGASDLDTLHAALGLRDCCGKCTPLMNGLLRDASRCCVGDAGSCDCLGCRAEAALQPA
jgi:bacterioferritin-associated ferredoxin